MKDDGGLGGYSKLTGFKSSRLKVSLAIGGANHSSSFSYVSANQERRKKFIRNVIEYLKKHNFDGCDLDWEFPKTEDRANFSMLVKEMSAAFKEKGLLLTAAIGSGPDIIQQSYEIDVISKHLDYLHVMCYDYHGKWDKNIGPNAPLKTDDSLSVSATLDNLLQKGAPSNKIVMGLPFYGTDMETGDRINYNAINNAISSGSWNQTLNKKSAQMHAKNNNSGREIVYDDEQSIALKVKCGKELKLGGFMVWSLEMDIMKGHNKFFLMKQLNKAIK